MGAPNEGDGGSAYIYSLNLPTFQSLALAADNSTITITLSEAVYSTSGGSGNLDASDFVLSISGGWATLTSATPTSISASGNVYTLGIGLSGFANSNEVLTVTPAENAIYNAAGNPVLTNQLLNSVNLNQKTLAQVASSGTSISGNESSLLKIDEDTYALALGRNLYTYTIPADGSSITLVADHYFYDGSVSYVDRWHSLIKVSGNIYALASSEPPGYGRDGYIKTYNIPNDGSSITQVASLEHDTEGADYPYNNFLKLYEDTYVLNYISGYSSGPTPYLKTFTIPTDGSSITEVDSLVTYTGSASNLTERGILKIDNNTLFKSWGNATYSISSDGSLIEKVKSHGISYNTIHSSVLHVEGDIYAFVAKDLIITLSISADGATATKVAELDYYPTLENYPTDGRLAPEFLKLNSNIYVVAYLSLIHI